MIIIGKVWYAKDAKGKWSKSDKPTADKSVDINKLMAEGVTDVQFVGPEVLNGAPTMVYAFKFNFAPANAKTTFTGAGKVWIGVTDGLPHQYELQGTMQSQSGNQVQVQIQLRGAYEYDSGINIQPPIP